MQEVKYFKWNAWKIRWDIILEDDAFYLIKLELKRHFKEVIILIEFPNCSFIWEKKPKSKWVKRS